MLLLTDASGFIVTCRQFWGGDSQHSSLQHCSTAYILQLLESTQRLYAAIQAAECSTYPEVEQTYTLYVMLYKRTNLVYKHC